MVNVKYVGQIDVDASHHNIMETPSGIEGIGSCCM